jgi:hypothetical protein
MEFLYVGILGCSLFSIVIKNKILSILGLLLTGILVGLFVVTYANCAIGVAVVVLCISLCAILLQSNF